MQYLTLQESVRRLRAAGVEASAETVAGWVRQERIRDVWQVGRHTFIYQAELESLISDVTRSAAGSA